MNASQALPLDVRLMDGAAALLFALAAVLALVALGGWVLRQPVWSLSQITVQGDVRHQSPVALRAHLAGRLEGNVWSVDLQHVQAVVETVPWVRSAVVQRKFPNQLHLTLEEHRPMAWWGQTGGAHLLNQQGEVFQAETSDPAALGWSELYGPAQHSKQVLELYQALTPQFARMGRDIQRLQLDERGSWRAVLDDGARIEIGRGSAQELQQRVAQFSLTVPTLLQHYGWRPLEVADLRHPDGYALRIQGVSTLAELQLPPLQAALTAPIADATARQPSPGRLAPTP